MVVEVSKILFRSVQSVVRQLQDANCNVLGAILNKAENAPGKSCKYKYKNYAYNNLEFKSIEEIAE